MERKGERHIDRGEWNEAKLIFKDLVKEDPGDSYYNFNLGLAYLKSGVEVEKAEIYLAQVNQSLVIERNYFYGQALHYNGKYDQAIQVFNDFMPLVASNADGIQLKGELERYIAQCQTGKRLERDKS